MGGWGWEVGVQGRPPWNVDKIWEAGRVRGPTGRTEPRWNWQGVWKYSPPSSPQPRGHFFWRSHWASLTLTLLLLSRASFLTETQRQRLFLLPLDYVLRNTAGIYLRFSVARKSSWSPHTYSITSLGACLLQKGPWRFFMVWPWITLSHTWRCCLDTYVMSSDLHLKSWVISPHSSFHASLVYKVQFLELVEVWRRSSLLWFWGLDSFLSVWLVGHHLSLPCFRLSLPWLHPVSSLSLYPCIYVCQHIKTTSLFLGKIGWK